MPITADNRARYPANWGELSRRVRFERAQGRCECEGECGQTHNGRCHALDGERAVFLDGHVTRKVVLTVAHLDHQPENNDTGNLRAFCQRCHNRYDLDHRIASRRRRRERESGQQRLFE